MREIPKNVKVKSLNIDIDYYCGNSVSLIRQRVKHGKICEAIDIAMKRLLKVGMTHANTNLDDIPDTEDTFDTSICYHIHSPLTLKYVAQKVKSNKKIGWIHSDFYSSRYPVQRLEKYIKKYDEFVAVSKKVEKEFTELCPWYQGNVSTTYNFLDFDEIIERSKENIEDGIFLGNNTTKLLTVGRFSKEKGIDLAIEVCGMLKRAKLKFHWFLIGYGELEDEYNRLIKKYDVEDCFTILGKKTNPYPYIKQCDIYVQPSRHEAFGLVIKEAKILKIPIICTDFDGADEQIDNGVNGIIVPLNNTTALYEEISKLIKSPELREKLSKELDKWQADDDLKEIIKHFD